MSDIFTGFISEAMDRVQLMNAYLDGYRAGSEANASDEVEIKNVIFNPPATIIFWSDGVKTVVQARNGEAFDPEKGLAMGVLKRLYGNTGRYYNGIKRWTQGYKAPEAEDEEVLEAFIATLLSASIRMAGELDENSSEAGE